MNFRKSLQEAFSKKEGAENLLANLENLKKGGGIDETQYTPMKNEYAKTLNEANVEIGHIKNMVSVELAARHRDLDVYNQELKNLELRFKVGELNADAYQKANQRTRQKIEKIEQKLSELKGFAESKSSIEVGGYIEAGKRGTTAVSGSTGGGDLVAALSHASFWFLPIILPLVVWLAYKDKSEYTAFQAKQALVFQIATYAIVLIAFIGFFGGVMGSAATLNIVSMIFLYILMLIVPGVIVIVGLIYSLYGAIKVWQGEDFRYRIVGNWVS